MSQPIAAGLIRQMTWGRTGAVLFNAIAIFAVSPAAGRIISQAPRTHSCNLGAFAEAMRSLYIIDRKSLCRVFSSLTSQLEECVNICAKMTCFDLRSNGMTRRG